MTKEKTAVIQEDSKKRRYSFFKQLQTNNISGNHVKNPDHAGKEETNTILEEKEMTMTK